MPTPDPDPTRRGGSAADLDLAHLTAQFTARLHALGVETAPERAGRFATAVSLACPATTRELYWLGRVTLTGSRDEIGAFDRVFNEVFRGVADVADHRGDPNDLSWQPLDHAPRAAPGADDARRPGTPRRGLASAGSAPGDADEGDARPAGAPSSQHEVLRARDFADCTPEELAALRLMLARLAMTAPTRSSRRRRRHRSGDRIDRRATLRRARRTGGHPVHLVRRVPGERRRRVVLIADVSGSMERYSRAYLYLLHGTARAWRAETFVFATRLTRLTPALRTSDPDLALRLAAASVHDWSGGTRIGGALRDFNDRWGRRGTARGAVVVIVSDGWESGDPAELAEQMARLSRLAHRIIWVNPRAKSSRYEPLVGGMQAALPHIDRFASGHSLAAIGEVLDAIAAP